MPLKLFASMGLTICALCYHTFIFIVYLSKKKFKAFDSSIYLFMYILTFVILVDECLYIYAMYAELDAHVPFISVETLCYIYIYLCIIWFDGLIIYILSKIKTSKSFEQYKKERLLSIVVLTAVSMILFIVTGFLKIDYPVGNSHLYVFAGPAVSVLYIIGIITLIIISIGLYTRKNYIEDYQKYPIYFCVIILITVNAMQYVLDYDWNSLSFLLSFVMITLYFTIESQDNKLIHELEQKSEEAEIAYNTKTKFLSNMSHEIKTPLNTIMNISQALLTDETMINKDTTKEETLIREASEELYENIDTILEISKAESNKLNKEENNYNMNELVFQIEQKINDKLKDDKKSFKIELNSNAAKDYFGDYQMISKMLSYIIEEFLMNMEFGITSLQINEKSLSNIDKEISFDIISPSNKMSEDVFQAKFNTFKDNNPAKKKDIKTISLKLILARELLDLLNGNYQVIEDENGLHCSITVMQQIAQNNTENAN